MNNTLQKEVISALKNYTGTAIKCREKEVQYEEFNEITDAIALNLAGKGIGPGSVVCVKMKRSEKMMIALGGVVKSGAAVLPVQSTVPEERFRKITDAVSISLIITDDNFESLCKKTENSETMLRMAGPDDLALILFTSGSTGIPKGVCHTQYSCISTAKQYPSELKNVGIDGDAIRITIAKTGMDYVSAYIFEYMPLAVSGIPMVLLTEEEMNSTEAVAKAISGNPDCSIFLTPTQADNYLKQGILRNENLKCLVLAGEMLPVTIREAIIENILPCTEAVSCYGSTECHLITISNCRDWDNTCGVVCDNYKVKVLDSNDKPCGAGIGGSIVVYGPGILKYYIGADDRRINIGGETYSFTGDHGEKTADGRIIIKGRTDRMIKYHGLRIEPGDIESNISQYPGISAVAVTESDSVTGTTVLCAYYESDAEIDVRDMRRFLMERLPVSMIPSGFIRMDRLPFNERGKINYKELRKRVFVPDDEKACAEIDAKAKQAADQICRTVEKLLNLDKAVQAEDNLFKLGMDSIRVYNLIDELEKHGYRISIDQIYMDPVISNLANAVFSENIGLPEQDIDTKAVYPATVEQAFWFMNLQQFKYMGFYISDCFVCGKTYTKDEFETRVDTIVSRHPVFRAEFSFNNGMPSQVFSKTPEVIKDYIDISDMGNGASCKHEINDEQRQFIERYQQDEYQKLLAEDRITDLKATYFGIDEETCVILFTCNHAESDGSSMRILREEFLSDELPQDQDSYIQYLQYIGDNSNIEEAVKYWTEYLRGAEPVNFTVIEDPRRPGHRPEFRTYTIRLEKERMAAYRNKCVSEGVSPAGYANYAYGKSILEAKNKSRIVFNMLTAGRGIPVKGIFKTVGCILEKIPVAICRDITPAEFQKQYIQCDRYSYLAPAMIWMPVTGKYEPPELAPNLISEIFPPVISDVYYREFNVRDYESMMESNFITMDDNEFDVYFHYDINAVPEEEILEVIKATEEKIKNYR